MRYVLMVDNDELTRYYKQSLENHLFREATKTQILGLNQDILVVWFKSKEAAAHAWGFLKEHRQEVIGVVTEAMLYPGKFFKEDERIMEGIRAGLVLYEKIRAQFPELPVIFLTNYHKDWTLLDPYVDGKLCTALRKRDTPPFDFVCEAEKFFHLSPVAATEPVAC